MCNDIRELEDKLSGYHFVLSLVLPVVNCVLPLLYAGFAFVFSNINIDNLILDLVPLMSFNACNYNNNFPLDVSNAIKGAYSSVFCAFSFIVSLSYAVLVMIISTVSGMDFLYDRIVQETILKVKNSELE